jgi:UTP-glucose-1-phosphate uridylyltransferase
VSEAPQRPSLKGRPLPDLAALGLAAEAVPTGKPVLLCLADVEQRPSRRAMRLLAEQFEALKQKGITVLAVQAAAISEDSFKAWREANSLPFAVGRLAEKPDKVKWATQVESLPWLILTEAQHRVAAEGFAIEELDAQLQALSR